MRWTDILEVCESGVIEEISDTATDFFRLYSTKLYAASIQTHVSRMIGCLEGYTTFNTTASTEFYTLPVDFVKMKALRYQDLYYLTESTKKPMLTPSSTTANPLSFFVQGSQVGLWPKPSTSSETIYEWYWRLAAPYAIRIKQTAASTATALGVKNIANSMVFTLTVGGVTTTYTFDLTAAANDTLAELIIAVNATATLKTHVLMSLGTSQVGTAASTGLEMIGTTSTYVSLLNQDRCFFMDPEIPEEMQMAILYPAIMYHLKMNDREGKLATTYYQQMQAAINEYYVRWKERYKGTGNLVIGGTNNMNPAPMGAGGWVVIE